MAGRMVRPSASQYLPLPSDDVADDDSASPLDTLVARRMYGPSFHLTFFAFCAVALSRMRRLFLINKVAVMSSCGASCRLLLSAFLVFSTSPLSRGLLSIRPNPNLRFSISCLLSVYHSFSTPRTVARRPHRETETCTD